MVIAVSLLFSVVKQLPTIAETGRNIEQCFKQGKHKICQLLKHFGRSIRLPQQPYKPVFLKHFAPFCAHSF